MSKIINKGDIIGAALDAARESNLNELFEKAPMLTLLVPMIAHEIEKQIFCEESETEGEN